MKDVTGKQLKILFAELCSLENMDCSSMLANYIESHDGYTFADFIEIALDHSRIKKYINPHRGKHFEKELAIAKLSALFFCKSRNKHDTPRARMGPQ